MKGKILIVYSHDLGYPLRSTVEESLFCFEKYSDKTCYYLNVAFKIPDYVYRVSFDLIIYHQTFISKRSLPKRFNKLFSKIEKLKTIRGYKILAAQDEYEYTDYLNQFINDFDIDHVYTLAHDTIIQTIYNRVDRNKVKFDRVLPGYLDKQSIEKINKYTSTVSSRSIDIGYRARKLSYSLGDRGYQKSKVGELFNNECKVRGVKADISTEPKDTFLGFSWYEFLCNCKYTIGLEGGASILDADGSLAEKVREYLSDNPNAKFDEVKTNVLGERLFDYHMISPRSLECCATKTCQILIEDDYNGILKPNIHYISLKKDFSNLDEVFEKMKDEKLRTKIVEKAWLDIVKNGNYYYEDFVQEYINELPISWSEIVSKDYKVYRRLKRRDSGLWKYKIPVRSWIVNGILNVIPAKLYNYIEFVYKNK